MEKTNIESFTEFYATFIKIKHEKLRWDYVVLSNKKDRRKLYGKYNKQFN